jgi:hypothetical protein
MAGAGIYSWEQLRQRPEPQEVWQTPFWFRLFAAGLGIVASVSVSYALASIVLPGIAGAAAGADLQIVVVGMLSLLLSALFLRLFNPLDWGRWFCCALAADGIYLPGKRHRLVFVPWSAVEGIDIERWYVKGEHSAARICLDLDQDIWSGFRRGARIAGQGRRRWVTVNVPGVKGEEIAARIDAFRKGATTQENGGSRPPE